MPARVLGLVVTALFGRWIGPWVPAGGRGAGRSGVGRGVAGGERTRTTRVAVWGGPQRRGPMPRDYESYRKGILKRAGGIAAAGVV
ncbi:hypothetical protein GCM10010168_87530 [Actinoplanes ianthinogenes]|uniref:Uncharacterized protein n=1 Tax=Actinoplanes ianthinogenes TaxID=122358 RepID=A0ABM7LSK7_9ACTN|nr:hypothetical protein Aiant_29050 [Actinoplanes ianthinogenes]GGR55008.1 hypothetical protein GCM10010168_87530 [Actinoplanes ianthinogenes]